MDIGIIITVIAFFTQFIGTVFTIGHFFGKNSDRIVNVETIQEGLRTEWMRMSSKMIDTDVRIGGIEKNIAVINAELGGEIGSFGKELKEMKESFNEFTKEMRAWRYEMTQNKNK